MALGWELLRGLPPGELTRLSSAQLEKYIETEEAAASSKGHADDAEEELAVAAGEEGSGY
jgi:hypothetical protein